MTTDSARPLIVVWRVTEACDLGCWYCEYNRTLRRPRRTANAPDVLAFGRVLAQFAASTGRPVLVSWLGGEPLLWPPLVAVGRHLRDELGLKLGITTNGQRLGSTSLLQHLTETYSEVTISVDGLREFHDTARGAPGLFDRLQAVVGELVERKTRQGFGPLLRANTILMRSNWRAFEALCETLSGWGFEELTFNALGGRPPGPDYQPERLRPDDLACLRAALPGIRQRVAPLGLRLRGGERYLQRLAGAANDAAAFVADCHPGAEFLFVDEQGRVAPCSFTSPEYGVPIQAIQTSGDLAQLPARLAGSRRQALHSACLDCPSPQVFGKFEAAEVR